MHGSTRTIPFPGPRTLKTMPEKTMGPQTRLSRLLVRMSVTVVIRGSPYRPSSDLPKKALSCSGQGPRVDIAWRHSCSLTKLFLLLGLGGTGVASGMLATAVFCSTAGPYQARGARPGGVGQGARPVGAVRKAGACGAKPKRRSPCYPPDRTTYHSCPPTDPREGNV